MSSKPVKPEAPEKIFIEKDCWEGAGGIWYAKDHMGFIEYIRSDLAKPQASPASALAKSRWDGTPKAEKDRVVKAMNAARLAKMAGKPGKKKKTK